MVLPPDGRIQPLLKRGSTADTNARLDEMAQRARDAASLPPLPIKFGGYLKVQPDKPTQARKALKRAKPKGR